MSDPDFYTTTSGGSRQVIRSPEQVALEFPVAGPSTRMLAYAIDWVIILLGQIALFVLLLLSAPIADRISKMFDVDELDATDPEVSGMMIAMLSFMVILQLVVELAYFLLSELASGGRSIGKTIVGLRVTRDGGLPLTFRASLVRNLLRAVDVLPYGYFIGLISIVVSPEAKRLGDMAAGTIVIRLDRPAPEVPVPDEEGEGASFRFDRSHIEAVGAAERRLIRQTLRRLGGLSPERRDEALQRAVDALCSRIDYRDAVPSHERRAFLRDLLRAARR